MGKLVVVFAWPYSHVPWISLSSLFMSDVRVEPDVEIIRYSTTNQECGDNMVVRHAIERGATEMLWLSADQSVPPDILKRLRAHGKDVVGALTATRQMGHHWLTFKLDEMGRGHQYNPQFPLERVDVTAPGCLLLKTSIFNKIKPPYFKTTLTNDGTGVVQSSDFYFFKKLKEAGIEVYVDSTLESYHLHEIALNAANLGRKLPYLEIVSGYSIPNTSAEQDAKDIAAGMYDEHRSSVVTEATP